MGVDEAILFLSSRSLCIIFSWRAAYVVEAIGIGMWQLFRVGTFGFQTLNRKGTNIVYFARS